MLAAVLLSAAAMTAQVCNGRMEGVVSGPAGAVVANANVAVRNNRTGVNVPASANEAGFCLLPSLPASNCTLMAGARGFRKAQVENIELNVAVTIRQDVQLEVGSPAASVTAEAGAIRVNTSDAQVGRSVTLGGIDTLPQLARNPMALVPYTPGVSIDAGDNPFCRVNGARQGSNNTRLDGVDASDAAVPRLGLSLTAFNADPIGQFRVIANGGQAEYGRNAGGQVEMITRSGTNQWHGAAFGFHRNTRLNANNFFNNASGVADRPDVFNRSGAYTLPAGRGRRWMSDVHSVVDALLGGRDLGVPGSWQSGSVFSVSSGRLTGPSTATTFINYSGDRNIGAVARRGGGVWLFTPEQIAALTEPAAFPNAGEIGSSGRNGFRGPRLHNFDASLVKRVKLACKQQRVTIRRER